MSCLEQAMVIFCDDLREEVTGKTTIVGMQGPEVALPAEAVQLRKIVAVLVGITKVRTGLEITAEVNVQGAEQSYSPPKPFTSVVELSNTLNNDTDDDDQELFMVNISGEILDVPLKDDRLIITAKFTVNGEPFDGTLIVDRAAA